MKQSNIKKGGFESRPSGIFERIRHRYAARDKSQNIIFGVYFVLFLFFSVFSIYPMFWCVINSMKTLEEYFEGSLALPNRFTLVNYANVFKVFEIAGQNYWVMLFNSFWQAFGSCFLNVGASVLIAYPIARYNFPGKKLLYGIIIFRITIPIIGSAASEYKLFRTLGMIDNPLSFWMAWVSGFDLTALVLYGYFSGISKTYSEAAFIDGANRLQVFFYAVLPQAMPCIVALYINQVIAKWNDYTTPQLYLRSYPNLAYGLYEFDGMSLFVEGGKPVYFASIILTAIPPIVLYSAGQKLMLENMSIGGIKG